MSEFNWEGLDGLFAYDSGCTDSGIHDEVLRAELVHKLHNMSKEDLLGLSRFVREQYLSEDALSQGYTLEDVAEFIHWLDDYMGFTL